MQRGGETALIRFGVFLAWWGEGLNFVIRFSFIKRAVLPTAIFKIPFDSAVSVFLILPLLIFFSIYFNLFVSVLYRKHIQKSQRKLTSRIMTRNKYIVR